MTVHVSVSEAKTRLTELLRRVEAGEGVVITRNGVEVAELRARTKPDRSAAFGIFRGRVVGDVREIASPFDDEWAARPVEPTS